MATVGLVCARIQPESIYKEEGGETNEMEMSSFGVKLVPRKYLTKRLHLKIQNCPN